MNRRILKYHIPVGGSYVEHMKGRIVYVDYQMTGMVTIWAESADNEKKAPRKFSVFGTGHTIPKEGSYVGTCIDRFTSLVWHLYEFPMEETP